MERSRSGLSGAIVSLLLVVIGITITSLVASFSFGVFGSGSQLSQVFIEKASIASSTSSVIVQIRNSGNQALLSVAPVLEGVSFSPANVVRLDPGKSAAFIGSGPFIAGKSYSVLVLAQTSGGSTVVEAVSVIAGP